MKTDFPLDIEDNVFTNNAPYCVEYEYEDKLCKSFILFYLFTGKKNKAQGNKNDKLVPLQIYVTSITALQCSTVIRNYEENL